mgnify:CR=1 FL=1
MSDILVLDRINKSFPGVQALKDMSFSIREGEVHAICGENGAGKSTLMKVVSGVYAQDSGDIYVRGEKATIKNPIDAFEKGIAIMYQETSLFNEMTILENLFLNHEPTKKVLGVPVIDHRTMEKKVDEILRHMNVSMDINAKVRDIGMAQKAAQERVPCHTPPVDAFGGRIIAVLGIPDRGVSLLPHGVAFTKGGTLPPPLG